MHTHPSETDHMLGFFLNRLVRQATPSSDVSLLQVLIRVHACGVNPVETYIRAGTYARRPPLPYTPGTDAAGVVESVGEGVAAVKV